MLYLLFLPDIVHYHASLGWRNFSHNKQNESFTLRGLIIKHQWSYVKTSFKESFFMEVVKMARQVFSQEHSRRYKHHCNRFFQWERDWAQCQTQPGRVRVHSQRAPCGWWMENYSEENHGWGEFWLKQPNRILAEHRPTRPGNGGTRETRWHIKDNQTSKVKGSC